MALAPGSKLATFVDGVPVLAPASDLAGPVNWSDITGPDKPANGATNTADPNAPFGNGSVQEALDRVQGALDRLAAVRATADYLLNVTVGLTGTSNGLLAQADLLLKDSRALITSAMQSVLITEANAARLAALELIDGKKIKLVVRKEITDRTEGQSRLFEILSLIGLVSEDGSAFIIDLDRLLVSPTQTFAGRLTQLTADLTGLIDTKASINQLAEAIATEHSATATLLNNLEVELQGNIDAKASLSQLAQAIADEHSATATLLNDLQVTLQGSIDTKASLTQLAQAVADEHSATATLLSALRVELQGNIDAKASLTQLAQAIADEHSATATLLTNLQTAINGDLATKASLTQLAQAISDEHSSTATLLTNLQAALQGNIDAKASLTQLAQAVADEHASTASLLNDLQVSMEGELDTKASLAQLAQAVADEHSATATLLSNLQAALQGNIDAKASLSQLAEVVASQDQARATAVETLNAAIGDVDGSVTSLRQVVVDPSGGLTAKGMFALDANGKTVGVYATNNGVVGILDLLFDSYIFRRPNGAVLFENDGDVLKLPNVEIDSLKDNTAVIPIVSVSNTTLAGGSSSTNGSPVNPTPYYTIFTREITMPKAGLIKVSLAISQAFTSGQTSRPWKTYVSVNGNALSESVRFGTVPGDSVSTVGYFYAPEAGTYTITATWGGHNTIQLGQRSFAVEAMPGAVPPADDGDGGDYGSGGTGGGGSGGGGWGGGPLP